MPGRVARVLPTFLVASLCAFALAVPVANGQGLSGTWNTAADVTSPASFVFQTDGRFKRSIDEVPLCKQQPGCRHFWTVSEGRYQLNGDRLSLSVQTARAILSSEGQDQPISQAMPGMAPAEEHYQLQRDSVSLRLTPLAGGSALVLYDTAAARAERPAPSQATRPVSAQRPTTSFPRGDLRDCLNLSDNAAIIRCSEKRR